MGRNGMSDLEFELERDGNLVYREVSDNEVAHEQDTEESLDGELEDDELFTGALDDAEADDAELDDHELEDDEADDGEADDELDDELLEPDVRGFAERFHELSLRDGESELELELEVGTLLREMEREYFLKGLLKKVAPGAKRLFKKGLAYAKKATPLGQVVSAATALSRGNLRGMLSSLASSAMSLASKHPAFAAVMPALSALGFKPGQPDSKAPWKNFAGLAKDAYGQLAKNLTATADEPTQAAEIAHRSFRTAVRGAAARTAGQLGGSRANGSARGRGKGPVRVVTLQRGDRLVIRVR